MGIYPKTVAEKTAKEYMMITRIEQEFYEGVQHQLQSIANSLKKLADSKEPMPEYLTDAPVKDEHYIDSPFDVLAVTNVQVFPFKEGADMEYIKGLANIVLNDQLQIRGLRIMEGENGLYVGFPNDPFYRGEELRSVVAPITRQLREHIENCVLEKYEAVTK